MFLKVFRGLRMDVKVSNDYEGDVYGFSKIFTGSVMVQMLAKN